MHIGLDTVEEFWNWDHLCYCSKAASEDSIEAFRADFGTFLNADSNLIHLAPSGHQGLKWLLQCLSDSRKIVMVPAFNCGVVAEAITSAGFDIRLYDFAPKVGFFDWDNLVRSLSPAVGVLLVTHYFGVPVDFRPALEACADRNITVIEDCAHTLGGTINKVPAGLLGDAAFYSFNYDKPISLGWGGLALVNNVARFRTGPPIFSHIPARDEELALLKRFITAMKHRRQLITKNTSLGSRILRRALLMQSKEFRKPEAVSIGAVQAELGRWCLKQYPEVARIRNAHADRLAREIPQEHWPIGTAVVPTRIKQKVRVDSLTALRYLSLTLQKKGLRVGNFNWPMLLKGDSSSKYPVSQRAATHWVDVPVHQNLKHQDLDRIISAFSEIA